MRKIVFDAAIIGLQATPSLISVPDSKSRAARRAGSIPAPGTTAQRCGSVFWFLHMSGKHQAAMRVTQSRGQHQSFGSIAGDGVLRDSVRFQKPREHFASVVG